jgi:protoporphyrin/coproporphyrin ferrochelatase
MKAILLMAHGAPADLNEVEAYVLRIRHGRPLEPHLMATIKDRYRQIGGSPLMDRSMRQAEALQKRIAEKIYLGMRHSSPYIRDVVETMISDGVENFVALCMAPQFSSMTIGAYQNALDEAIGNRVLPYKLVRSYARHPLLIRAFHARLATALNAHPDAFVIFTAHSLPEKVIQQADPYDFEAKETARLIALSAGLKDWKFAYQSQGLTSEKWLGPTVESRIDEIAALGRREVIVAPIGFVCDHVEILYDVDVMYRAAAATKGVQLFRTESLNDSPEFIELLSNLVVELP